MAKELKNRKRIIVLSGIVVFFAMFTLGLVLLLYSIIYSGIWSTIARDLSFVLIPISLMVLIYEMVLRMEWVALIRECMEEETFLKAGGKRVYLNFDKTDIEDEIEKASNVEICIMQSYIPQILMEGSKTRWRNLITDSIKRGCHLKVLLLSPNERAYIENRSKQLNRNPQTFQEDIVKCIKFLKELKKEFGERVEVKAFNEYPIGPVLIVGRTLYHGFFLQKKDALECPFIKIELINGGAFKEFRDAFQRVWETGDPIDC